MSDYSVEAISGTSGDYSNTSTKQMWDMMYKQSIMENSQSMNRTDQLYSQEQQDIYQSTGSDMGSTGVASF